MLVEACWGFKGRVCDRVQIINSCVLFTNVHWGEVKTVTFVSPQTVVGQNHNRLTLHINVRTKKSHAHAHALSLGDRVDLQSEHIQMYKRKSHAYAHTHSLNDRVNLQSEQIQMYERLLSQPLSSAHDVSADATDLTK